MKNKAAELAVMAHGQFSHELSPVYTQMRQTLLAELALKNIDASALRGEHEDRLDNGSLILEFVKNLPGSTKLDSANPILENGQLDELLLQRSASFFYEEHPDYGPTYYSSYYLVGYDSSNGRILASPMRDETGDEVKPPENLVVFGQKVEFQDRRSRQKRDTEAFFQDEITKLLADIEGYRGLSVVGLDELAEQLFDKKKGNFVIHSSSLESKKLHDVRTHGSIIRSFRAGYTPEDVRYLTDDDMIQFDVPSHLSRLATMFNKNDELTNLLQGMPQHVAQSNSMPDTQTEVQSDNQTY